MSNEENKGFFSQEESASFVNHGIKKSKVSHTKNPREKNTFLPDHSPCLELGLFNFLVLVLLIAAQVVVVRLCGAGSLLHVPGCLAAAHFW